MMPPPNAGQLCQLLATASNVGSATSSPYAPKPQSKMPKYLVSIHRPNDYNPAVSEDETMAREIDALNDEMIAAGVRVFVGGLQPITTAKSLHRHYDGSILSTDGIYLKDSEHVGGFWVLEVTDQDAALAWGRKAAIACRASVEVRPFH